MIEEGKDPHVKVLKTCWIKMGKIQFSYYLDAISKYAGYIAACFGSHSFPAGRL